MGTFVDCRVHHSVEWEKVYLTITLQHLLVVIQLVVVGLCLSALFLWRLINNALAMANLGRFIWILCNFLGLVLFYFHYLFYREHLDTLGTLGLRPGHIKDLTSSSTAEAGRRPIKELASECAHVINVKVSTTAQNILFAAKQTALRKKDGGIRP